MKHRLKNGDTFCVLPWIHSFQNLNNNFYTCCYSTEAIANPSSEEMDAIRKKIWSGEKVEHCKHCYNLEDKNTISPRQRESARWLSDPDVAKIFDSVESPDYKPVYFDIRLDNKCNSACIMCTPLFSSLWAKELKIQVADPEYKIDLENIVNAKKIYFAGGEPLIIQKYLDLIEFISNNNPNVELVINTNLSNIPDDTLVHLKRIKNTTIVASVDGHGPVHEYHRYPLKWDKFLRNLEKIKEANLNIMFNTVASAVSVFGFDKLSLIESYQSQWEITNIESPQELSLKNIPAHLKEIAVSKVSELKNTNIYKTNIRFKKNIDFIISSINENGDSLSLSNFIKSLDTRRNLNHTEFLGVNLIEK